MTTHAERDPQRMREVVAEYVSAVHAAYVRQAQSLSPAAQARMPLLQDAPLEVAAVGVRHLHVVATRERLADGQRGTAAKMEGSAGPCRWTISFYDPIIIPPLGVLDETAGPAFDDVRRLLGIGTHIYHLTLSPSAVLSAHHAQHTGTGLANAHAVSVREFEAIARAVGPARAGVVRELEGSLHLGLARASALLARSLAPDDPTVSRLAVDAEAGGSVDAGELRRALLVAVSGTGPRLDSVR